MSDYKMTINYLYYSCCMVIIEMYYDLAPQSKWWYPLVNIQKLLKMTIEIVALPTKHGDFP